MAYSNQVKINDAGRQVIDVFGGLNRAMRIREGEWSETMNLSSDEYPLLSTRKPLLAMAGYPNVIDMIDKDDLWVLFRDGNTYNLWNAMNPNERRTLGTSGEITPPTGLVGMGAYIIVLGTNVWFNTADGTHGTIDAKAEIDASDYFDGKSYGVQIRPCDAKGNVAVVKILYDKAFAEEVEADDSQSFFADGECYAIGTEKLIRQYDREAAEHWKTLPHYVRIDAKGIGASGYVAGDSIDLSGLPTEWKEGIYNDGIAYGGAVVPEHTWNMDGQYDEDPNGLHEIAAVGEDFIVLKDVFYTRNITADEVGVPSGAKAAREMPDMDFVVEAQNRLWGCKYGIVDGELVNEIYASTLGDFKNWRRYDGTSMASWAASVGTDGKWTGAANYNGNPVFFKEGRMHKVTVSAYGAHQIRDYAIDGVRDGCSKSLCSVDGRLYWVGKFGIYAYDGSIPPARISSRLGAHFFGMQDDGIQFAAADGVNRQVFFYLEHDRGTEGYTGLYAYDVSTQTWNMIRAKFTVGQGHVTVSSATSIRASRFGVYAAHAGLVTDLLGNYPIEEEENPIEWSCTSGLIGYGDVEQKYVSRFVLRAMLAAGSKMNVWIEYDSDGVWHHAGGKIGTSGRTTSFVLPLIPQRCDHFRIRMSGTGEMALFSFSKKYQKGSDVK